MSWRHHTGIGRNNLDFVRFVLAIAVIFAHSYAVAHGNEKNEPLMRITGQQLDFGALAVDWFFVISGFLITHSWLRGSSTIDYFKKRILRIYPGFIVAVLLCTFVVAPMAEPSFSNYLFHEVGVGRLIRKTLVLNYNEPLDAFPRNPLHVINGSLWTIPYEFRCYIGVAVLGLLSMLRPTIALIGFIILTAINGVIVGKHLHPDFGHTFSEVCI